MIKSAITVSLVPEASGGPFVFWDGLANAFEQAASLGYDGVEIFAPGPDAVDNGELTRLVEHYRLAVAAVGTGAGMVKHGLSLTDPDADKRESARVFVRQMIEFGGRHNAPAIIGSMQGRWGGNVSRGQALDLLADALEELGNHAAQFGVPLLYEPLNRYETNLIKTMSEGVQFLDRLSNKNVRLLADLFHMNIEEVDIAAALATSGDAIGHVHFVDSNRQAAGFGHMSYQPIAAALKEIQFDGFASAEAFPLPDSQTAARMTIDAFNKYLR
ncbi:MAG: sugar phosphate isomerase/epimerase [Planctomycetales bacterium]|nr:sugar phosphate isomerase/epimerase [Planctomycetales bacterium]